MPDVFKTAHSTVSVDLAGEVRVWMSDGQHKHMTALIIPQAWNVLLDYAEHLRDEKVGVWRSPVREWHNFVVYANVAPTINPERIMVLDENSGHVDYFDGMPASGDVTRIPARVARLYYLQATVPDSEPAIQGLTQEALDALKGASA